MEDKYLHKAKRTDNGEWVQGYLVYDKRDKMYRIITEINYSTGTCLTADNAPRVDSSTICRCTGLKDKNGKLIWENDIVELLGHRGVIKYVCVVSELDIEKILIGKKYNQILCVLQGVKTFYMLVKTIIIYHCGKSIGILMMRMIR